MDKYIKPAIEAIIVELEQNILDGSTLGMSNDPLGDNENFN